MSKPIQRNVEFAMLNKAQIEKIHEKSIYIMENIGMRYAGERALKLLKDAGASVDGNGIVKLPAKLVEKAIASAPKSLTLYNRDGKEMMQIDSKNQCYFGTHADQLEFVDPLTNKVRPFLKADIKTMCKVASALKNIYFVLSVGMTADVKPEVQTQSTFIETIRNFDKVINFSTNDIESLTECINIAAEFAGGLKNLQDKPFIFNYCEPIPPLTHPIESTEKIMISAENRIPFVYMPYCMMGGTSPMSAAATLAQCNAEALGGLVLAQLTAEGSPFIYGAMPSIFDMQTTIGSYGAPDFHRNIAAMADLVAYYGLPFYGTAGCSDAKNPDPQAVSEVTYEIMSTMLSKANIIHDVGVMDHCNSVSPEMVVIADEIIECLKSYTGGINIDEEEFALDTIKDVGHGGHYLEEDHTLENYNSIFYPKLFSRKMQNPEESEVMPKVNAKLKDIIENYNVPELDKGRLDILEKWEKKIGI